MISSALWCFFFTAVRPFSKASDSHFTWTRLREAGHVEKAVVEQPINSFTANNEIGNRDRKGSREGDKGEICYRGGQCGGLIRSQDARGFRKMIQIRRQKPFERRKYLGIIKGNVFLHGKNVFP
jgi:hypothetical protein